MLLPAPNLCDLQGNFGHGVPAEGWQSCQAVHGCQLVALPGGSMHVLLQALHRRSRVLHSTLLTHFSLLVFLNGWMILDLILLPQNGSDNCTKPLFCCVFLTDLPSLQESRMAQMSTASGMLLQAMAKSLKAHVFLFYICSLSDLYKDLLMLCENNATLLFS